MIPSFFIEWRQIMKEEMSMFSLRALILQKCRKNQVIFLDPKSEYKQDSEKRTILLKQPDAIQKAKS